MTWYSELGFKANPLDVRPNPDLIGLEKQEKRLMNHILKEEICFLNGLTGSGKTSLLMRVQKTLPGHAFIYLDAHELPEGFNLEKEIQNKRGFFDILTLRKFPRKKPVLIIDEFQATDTNLVLQARAGWENPIQRKIKSIVIAQISKHLGNVTDSFKERLGTRIIEMQPLDDDEMIEILKKRLQHKKKNYADKIHDDALTFIVRCSGNNPRRLLEYVDELFDFHYRKFADKNPIHTPDYQISYYGAKEILGLDKISVEGFTIDTGADVKEQNSTAKLNAIYTEKEISILEFIAKKNCSIRDIAKRFKLSGATTSKYLASLRRKHGIVFAGKIGNQKLWQVSPSTSRLMVKV